MDTAPAVHRFLLVLTNWTGHPSNPVEKQLLTFLAARHAQLASIGALVAFCASDANFAGTKASHLLTVISHGAHRVAVTSFTKRWQVRNEQALFRMQNYKQTFLRVSLQKHVAPFPAEPARWESGGGKGTPGSITPHISLAW